jgi:hypothetical protein
MTLVAISKRRPAAVAAAVTPAASTFGVSSHKFSLFICLLHSYSIPIPFLSNSDSEKQKHFNPTALPCPLHGIIEKYQLMNFYFILPSAASYYNYFHLSIF